MSQPAQPDFAKPFTDMAERIQRNQTQEFGGAILIVPPTGEPIDVVLVGSKADLMLFWSSAKTKVEIAARDAIEAAEAQHRGGFPRQR